MSLSTKIEEEIAIFEEIRNILKENGYSEDDLSKIIDYLNEAVTLISGRLVQELDEEVSDDKLERIKKDLQLELNILLEKINKNLHKKLPSDFNHNVVYDFIPDLVKEVLSSSKYPSKDIQLYSKDNNLPCTFRQFFNNPIRNWYKSFLLQTHANSWFDESTLRYDECQKLFLKTRPHFDILEQESITKFYFIPFSFGGGTGGQENLLSPKWESHECKLKFVLIYSREHDYKNTLQDAYNLVFNKIFDRQEVFEYGAVDKVAFKFINKRTYNYPLLYDNIDDDK